MTYDKWTVREHPQITQPVVRICVKKGHFLEGLDHDLTLVYMLFNTALGTHISAVRNNKAKSQGSQHKHMGASLLHMLFGDATIVDKNPEDKVHISPEAFIAYLYIRYGHDLGQCALAHVLGDDSDDDGCDDDGCDDSDDDGDRAEHMSNADVGDNAKEGTGSATRPSLMHFAKEIPYFKPSTVGCDDNVVEMLTTVNEIVRKEIMKRMQEMYLDGRALEIMVQHQQLISLAVELRDIHAEYSNETSPYNDVLMRISELQYLNTNHKPL